IVEVLSPGTGRQDKNAKFNLYQKYGVREYWIADPVHKVLEVWQLQDGHYTRQGAYGPEDTFESAVLGKVVDVSKIFTA
ncbi:MAG: Uma2 family endonuclease, partial [Anaerolineae bacterium]